jgi:hypothetical protein
VLTRFAEAIRPEPKPLVDEETLALEAREHQSAHQFSAAGAARSAASGRSQSEESRADRVHAKAAYDAQRDDALKHSLATRHRTSKASNS